MATGSNIIWCSRLRLLCFWQAHQQNWSPVPICFLQMVSLSHNSTFHNYHTSGARINDWNWFLVMLHDNRFPDHCCNINQLILTTMFMLLVWFYNKYKQRTEVQVLSCLEEYFCVKVRDLIVVCNFQWWMWISRCTISKKRVRSMALFSRTLTFLSPIKGYRP